MYVKYNDKDCMMSMCCETGDDGPLCACGLLIMNVYNRVIVDLCVS